jgi:hypothetical protein
VAPPFGLLQDELKHRTTEITEITEKTEPTAMKISVTFVSPVQFLTWLPPMAGVGESAMTGLSWVDRAVFKRYEKAQHG